MKKFEPELSFYEIEYYIENRFEEKEIKNTVVFNLGDLLSQLSQGASNFSSDLLPHRLCFRERFAGSQLRFLFHPPDSVSSSEGYGGLDVPKLEFGVAPPYLDDNMEKKIYKRTASHHPAIAGGLPADKVK